MNHTGAAAALTAEAIEAAFGGRWGIWLSSTGRWWAALQEGAGPAGSAAGPHAAGPHAAGPHAAGPDAADIVLVRADDPDQLQARIQEQEAKPVPRRDTASWVPVTARGDSRGRRAMPGHG